MEKASATAAWTARKRWIDARLRKPRISRSRSRIGACEPSTLLLLDFPSDMRRGQSEFPRGCGTGTEPVRDQRLRRAAAFTQRSAHHPRRRRLAALALEKGAEDLAFAVDRTQGYMCRPHTEMNIPSRCHRPLEAPPRRARSPRAIAGPKRASQARAVSCETAIAALGKELLDVAQARREAGAEQQMEATARPRRTATPAAQAPGGARLPCSARA